MPEKFPLGYTLITTGVDLRLHPQDVQSALQRHAAGDWGEVGDEDKALNNQALKDGSRLLSAYTDRNHVKFWILTEADRSLTTVLLPEEY